MVVRSFLHLAILALFRYHPCISWKAEYQAASIGSRKYVFSAVKQRYWTGSNEMDKFFEGGPAEWS
jgi:hypothetical protein